jgi:peptidoglycan/xylan/chitin deacetylase (PgdA/CDA1 family)
MIGEHLPKKQSKFNRLRVKPVEFDKQLNWLKNNGWVSMTMAELAESENIPKKTVVLTFDDGYADNYINAFPLLKKHDMKATIYIVVNRHNKDWSTDKDTNRKSDELNNEQMLTHKMILEMLDSNIIEIGSHTVSHANLTKLSEEQKRYEISESKKYIENEYGIECKSFAYPFGFFDDKDVKIARESGYTSAVTTINGYHNFDNIDKFLIKRVMISGRQSMFDFMLKILKGRNR